MILRKVWTKYSMTIWNIGKACMAHARRKFLFFTLCRHHTAGLIEQTGQRVVIAQTNMTNLCCKLSERRELQNITAKHTKPFYGALKSKDGCIKLGFLTGVTKFGKVSVFSDLNNLIDISMDEQYVELCGITEKEIHDNMEEDLHILADKQK